MLGGYKAFDLNGNEVEPMIIEKKKQPEKFQKIKSKKENIKELDQFTEIIRNTVGATYSHDRSPTKTRMD